MNYQSCIKGYLLLTWEEVAFHDFNIKLSSTARISGDFNTTGCVVLSEASLHCEICESNNECETCAYFVELDKEYADWESE